MNLFLKLFGDTLDFDRRAISYCQHMGSVHEIGFSWTVVHMGGCGCAHGVWGQGLEWKAMTGMDFH